MNKAIPLALTVLLLAGCASVGQGVKDAASVVAGAMDAVLPPEFNGPLDLSRSDGWFDITLKAQGVKKADGHWTWASVHYERKTHLPFWQSDVKIDLGEQK